MSVPVHRWRSLLIDKWPRRGGFGVFHCFAERNVQIQQQLPSRHKLNDQEGMRSDDCKDKNRKEGQVQTDITFYNKWKTPSTF